MRFIPTILLLVGTAFVTTICPAQHTTAEAILQANLKATGGMAAWQRITSSQTEGVSTINGPMGDQVTATLVGINQYPGYRKLHVTSETPMGAMESTQYTTPEAAWAETPMGRRDLPVRRQLALLGAKEELVILQDDTINIIGLEDGTHEGNPVHVVTIEMDGFSLKRYYDPASLLLVAAERPAREGDTTEWVFYEDYREVDGLVVPFASVEKVQVRMATMEESGQESESTHTVDAAFKLDNITWNVPIEDGLFQR